MEHITIRDFTPNDFNGLSELWQLTNLGNPSRGDNLDIITHSIKLGGKLLVAVTSENKIIGSSWMTFDGRRIHLHHVGVHPGWQGKGIGKKITRESLKFVKAKGYQVKLEVHKNNARAISLYKQFGFQYLGDYDVYIIRDTQSINL